MYTHTYIYQKPSPSCVFVSSRNLVAKAVLRAAG